MKNPLTFLTRCYALARHRGASLTLATDVASAGDEQILATLEALSPHEIARLDRLYRQRAVALEALADTVASPAPDPRRTCEAMWGWDVDFDATCGLSEGHRPPVHRAEVEGNDGVVAVIEWPSDSAPVDDQRAALDACTGDLGCRSTLHLSDCRARG